MQQLLRRWSCSTPDATPLPTAAIDPLGEPPVLVAGVRAAFDGWIAAVNVGGDIRVVGARNGSQASPDPHCVLEIARGADGVACVTSPSRVARVLEEVDAYLEAERAAADAGVGGIGFACSGRGGIAHCGARGDCATAPASRHVAPRGHGASERGCFPLGRRGASAGRVGVQRMPVTTAPTPRRIGWSESSSRARRPCLTYSPTGRYSRLYALIVLVPGGNRE